MTATVLRGGRVLTCDRSGRVAEALAISDGRVIAAGDEDEVRAAAGPGAAVAELDGGVVLPGLIDTHPHLMHFGVLAEPCADLSDASDHADIVARVAARAREVAEGEWVMATPVEPRFAGSGAANAGLAQAVTREEALAMWTREAAHVLRWDGIGSLEPGSQADLIVVDRDPLTCGLDALPETKVLATLLGGEPVHGGID
jgi:predicted amidohydrolase YtcJ